MFAFCDSPFGLLDMYNISINTGIVVTVVVQGILLVREQKKYCYLLFLPCYLLTLYIGRYLAAFVRCVNDGALDGKMNLLDAVLDLAGTHFLGYVIAFMVLFLPIAWFFRELFAEIVGFEICSNKNIGKITEVMTVGLPIQHIFNRIGCLCRGCCYGVSYDGIFSIVLPYNTIVNHRVFPCQILEIIGMIIILVVSGIQIKRRKPILKVILLGFSITFFVSEFFTENPYAVRHFGLTYIQIFCVAMMLTGILTRRNLDKLAKENNI